MKFRIFVTLLIVSLATLLTGCCSTVARCGDAKIKTCWEFIHEVGTRSYYMKLPRVDLAAAGTNTLRIRNLPAFLQDKFHYSLKLPVLYEENLPSIPGSWQEAKIAVVFRDLNGRELYKRMLLLGEHYQEDLASRDVAWIISSGPVERLGSDFDILIVVEKPSLKKNSRDPMQKPDLVSLSGEARVRQPN